MSVSEDLNNPNLFTENEAGVYTYTDDALGKTAHGQLAIAENPNRDNQAQRTVGGAFRRTEDTGWGKDDGGHLIGARFGGATDERNLTPQNSNLNRGTYKRAENSWAEHLAAGDKVYVRMEAYTGGESQRPSNYMGYAIIEHSDENGVTSRTVEYYSFDNESRMTQDTIDKEVQAFYESNPGYAEEQARQNTTMEYIWNEEKGEAVKNPYYDPDAENEAPKGEPAGKNQEEESLRSDFQGEQDPNTDHSHNAQNPPDLPDDEDHSATDEQSSSEAQLTERETLEAVADETAAEQPTEMTGGLLEGSADFDFPEVSADGPWSAPDSADFDFPEVSADGAWSQEETSSFDFPEASADGPWNDSSLSAPDMADGVNSSSDHDGSMSSDGGMDSGDGIGSDGGGQDRD